MSNQNKNPLAVGTMQRISIAHARYFKSMVQKRKPDYFYELKEIPIENPIFISVDRVSHNYITCHQGFSLLCERDSSSYELDFCFNREVWIFYSGYKYFDRAMELARTIQWHSACKISVILIAKRGSHGNC